MAIVIRGKVGLTPPKPSGVHCFASGQAVRLIGHYAHKHLIGQHGVIVGLMEAHGLRDVRPRDDLYRVMLDSGAIVSSVYKDLEPL